MLSERVLPAGQCCFGSSEKGQMRTFTEYAWYEGSSLSWALLVAYSWYELQRRAQSGRSAASSRVTCVMW